jgi:hypothetical protein
VEFCCFDEDHVLIGRARFGVSAGGITGKAGDGFRVIVSLSSVPSLGVVRKVEVRPVEGDPKGSR